ncbi:MAG: HD domain-containing protein [Geminicoccaceae bacterium]
MFKAQRVRDPLHNLIEFRPTEFENALWDVIQSPAFQRLRRIKQLGLSNLVYPGATHSRFAHSLGTFDIARQLMRIVREHLEKANQYRDSRAEQALAAALLHDLGHGPFSHAFEDVGRRLKLKMADHQHVSDVLIRNSEVAAALNKLGRGFADDVADIIKSEAPRDIYSAVVSSQFDADRLDYMQRDRLMTETHYGVIDFKWLIANLEIGEVAHGVDEKAVGKLETFVLGPKAVLAAEAYVLGLFQLYPAVYLHKTTRGAEKLFSELLIRVFKLVGNGSIRKTGLPSNHPLVQFAKEPDSVDSALHLDDTIVWGSLSLMAESRDPIIREFSHRLRDRKLLKAVDVGERIRNDLGLEAEPDERELADKACAAINEKVMEWLSTHDGGRPRILVDQDEREPYKRFQESKGPLNQIRIRTGDAKLVDLGERSRVVRAIETFKLYRLYTSDADSEALGFLEKIIKEEVKRNGARGSPEKQRRKGSRHHS